MAVYYDQINNKERDAIYPDFYYLAPLKQKKRVHENKLIFVEDDLILGTVIANALTDNEFEVDFLETLDGLLEKLASALPDLLILDIEVNK